MYVCLCHGITDQQIKEAVNEGANSVKDVSKSLKVATQCGKCAMVAKEIIEQEVQFMASSQQALAKQLAYRVA